MKIQRPSKRTIIRYALFQIPDLIILLLILIFVRQWVELPGWLEWTIIAFWIGKDIVLFPFVWRAYDRRDPHSMVGAQGIAEERLAPSGYVRVGGELWKAETIKGVTEIPKGATVRVREVHGLTLIVEPGPVRVTSSPAKG